MKINKFNGVAITNVKSVKQTKHALLVKMGGKEIWVPQSQITDDSEVYRDNQDGTLVVKEWWAEKQGLVR